MAEAVRPDVDGAALLANAHGLHDRGAAIGRTRLVHLPACLAIACWCAIACKADAGDACATAIDAQSGKVGRRIASNSLPVNTWLEWMGWTHRRWDV